MAAFYPSTPPDWAQLQPRVASKREFDRGQDLWRDQQEQAARDAKRGRKVKRRRLVEVGGNTLPPRTKSKRPPPVLSPQIANLPMMARGRPVALSAELVARLDALPPSQALIPWA